MKTIHKYTIYADKKKCWVEMPSGAEIIKVGLQSGQIRIWAIVDTEVEAKNLRLFHVIGTGHDIATPREDLDYLATVLVADDTLVWHIFEETVSALGE